MEKGKVNKSQELIEKYKVDEKCKVEEKIELKELDILFNKVNGVIESIKKIDKKTLPIDKTINKKLFVLKTASDKVMSALKDFKNEVVKQNEYKQ